VILAFFVLGNVWAISLVLVRVLRSTSRKHTHIHLFLWKQHLFYQTVTTAWCLNVINPLLLAERIFSILI